MPATLEQLSSFSNVRGPRIAPNASDYNPDDGCHTPGSRDCAQGCTPAEGAVDQDKIKHLGRKEEETRGSTGEHSPCTVHNTGYSMQSPSRNQSVESGLEQDKTNDFDTKEEETRGSAGEHSPCTVHNAGYSVQSPSRNQSVESGLGQDKTNYLDTEDKGLKCCNMEQQSQCEQGTAVDVKSGQMYRTVEVDPETCKVGDRSGNHCSVPSRTDCTSKTPQQKRGIKRKRDSDSEDKPYSPGIHPGKSNIALTPTLNMQYNTPIYFLGRGVPTVRVSFSGSSVLNRVYIFRFPCLKQGSPHKSSPFLPLRSHNFR